MVWGQLSTWLCLNSYLYCCCRSIVPARKSASARVADMILGGRRLWLKLSAFDSEYRVLRRDVSLNDPANCLTPLELEDMLNLEIHRVELRPLLKALTLWPKIIWSGKDAKSKKDSVASAILSKFSRWLRVFLSSSN